MFLRSKADINFYLKRTDFIKYFDEYNLSRKSKYYIRRVSKKVNDKNSFTYFKHWILWRWVNLNFKVTESFIFKLKRNIKKLEISLTAKEEIFIFELEELVFNSWRPLKEIPVRFDLDKKEKINLYQGNVFLHNLNEEDKKITQIGQFDCYYSNKKVYLNSKNKQKNIIIEYNNIISVVPKSYGTVIKTSKKTYLFRGKNRLLTYVLLQRMVPRLKLNILEIDNLYDYFDFWNQLLLKIN